MRLALIALAGCSTLPAVTAQQGVAADAAPAGDHAVLAVPGEALEFRVRLRGIVVGRVRTAIGEPGVFEGKRSIIARSRGETDGMVALIGKIAWECKSTIDLDRGLPIVNEEEVWLEFAGEREHDRDTDRWEEHTTYHDVHSAVGRMRGWRSQVGSRIAFDMRIAELRLDVQATHVGREYLTAAKAHAIRYEGQIAGRYKFVAWISDDPQRVPLRLHTQSKWGAIEVDLVAYQLIDQLPSETPHR